MAEAEANPGRSARRTAAKILVRDGVLLHAQWRRHANADAALLAGAMWMGAQRLMPAADGADSLEASWRTRVALRRRLADVGETGQLPSPLSRTLFAALSAHTALARTELLTTITEARMSRLIGAGGRGLSWFATGLEAVGDSLFGSRCEGSFTPRLPHEHWLDPVEDDLHRGGTSMLELARGLRALDRLDCHGVSDALERTGEPLIFGDATWSVRVGLAAFREALWGDPARAMELLNDSSSRQGDSVHDALEPLAQMVLGSARVAILNLIGAKELARGAAEEMPALGAWSARARTLLWCGETEEAVRVAELGLLQEGLWHRLRTQLLLVKAAALALDPNAAEEDSAVAIRTGVRRCAAEGLLLPLALLPTGARAALLAAFEAGAEGDDLAVLAGVRERLAGLAVQVDLECRKIRLTRREQVLLPMLASAEPVPEIARSLHLSANTVRKQVVTLRAKFSANSRAELVRHARDEGFLR